MDKIESLIIKINEMRKDMCDLISEKSDLLDPKVVQLSQDLDEILNAYHKLLENKKRK